MGNSLRCCLACVLPCGALDLIRIVHLNGYVEELPGPTTASRVLQNYPNHVLTKPCLQQEAVGRRILILSPESELKRGSIYFLIPSSSLPAHVKNKKILNKKKGKNGTVGEDDRKMVDSISRDGFVKKEKASKASSASSHRRKAPVGVWRPNLRSISEDLS